MCKSSIINSCTQIIFKSSASKPSSVANPHVLITSPISGLNFEKPVRMATSSVKSITNFNIFLKLPNKPSKQIKVNHLTFTNDLFTIINDQFNIPDHFFYISCANNVIYQNQYIGDYNITKDSTLIVRIRGRAGSEIKLPPVIIPDLVDTEAFLKCAEFNTITSNAAMSKGFKSNVLYLNTNGGTNTISLTHFRNTMIVNLVLLMTREPLILKNRLENGSAGHDYRNIIVANDKTRGTNVGGNYFMSLNPNVQATPGWGNAFMQIIFLTTFSVLISMYIAPSIPLDQLELMMKQTNAIHEQYTNVTYIGDGNWDHNRNNTDIRANRWHFNMVEQGATPILHVRGAITRRAPARDPLNPVRIRHSCIDQIYSTAPIHISEPWIIDGTAISDHNYKYICVTVSELEGQLIYKEQHFRVALLKTNEKKD